MYLEGSPATSIFIIFNGECIMKKSRINSNNQTNIGQLTDKASSDVILTILKGDMVGFECFTPRAFYKTSLIVFLSLKNSQIMTSQLPWKLKLKF